MEKNIPTEHVGKIYLEEIIIAMKSDSVAVTGDGWTITYSTFWAVQGKVWELWPPDGDGLTDEHLQRVFTGTCLPHKLTAAAKQLRDLGLLVRK